jgi:hypothetical protein
MFKANFPLPLGLQAAAYFRVTTPENSTHIADSLLNFLPLGKMNVKNCSTAVDLSGF